jgi:hypothetical protein
VIGSVARWVHRVGGRIAWWSLPPDRTPSTAYIYVAAKEYRDAEWALRILDGEGCNRLDPRWNAAVERWRAADAELARLLGERSPFFSPSTAVRSAVQTDDSETG